MRLLMFLLLVAATCSVHAEEYFTDFLPQQFINTSVLLETRVRNPSKQDSSEYKFFPIASSVLVSSGDSVSERDSVFLVTAKHVVEDVKNLYLRFHLSSNADSIVRISIDSVRYDTTSNWILHPGLDLAVIRIKSSFLITFAEKAVPTQSLVALYDEVELGQNVYVIGYPVSVESINFHVVRSGLIAAKLAEKKLLIDSRLYPGNSGSPVFLTAIRALKFGYGIKGPKLEGREPKLVGIVSKYLPYIEDARSVQTKRKRISFEENSGLAIVIASDAILELIKNP
ncbi:MAG: trypsin-like peptidase domain-containing protein [Desulfobacteraceae bacterium]|nr:trypsin-like peptidase domain-containing protein [Desulfobacteraceae bacterium]